MSTSTATPLLEPEHAVDSQNPWLGLVSFTEALRDYFHGRDKEADELFRRVKREVLTVLFGQSGLGKTSLLQAGLFPSCAVKGSCRSPSGSVLIPRRRGCHCRSRRPWPRP